MTGFSTEAASVGWKLNLLARRTQPGDDFDGLARALGFEAPARETISFERALHPSPGVALAHWNDHLLLLSSPLVEPLLQSPSPNAATRGILEVLGPQPLLVATLHSVTNLYGYALFENGKLIRGRTGAADDGLIWQQGSPFEWEHSEEDEFDGEQAVFTFLSSALGCSLDTASDQLYSLPLKRYHAAGLVGKLKRLLGLGAK